MAFSFDFIHKGTQETLYIGFQQILDNNYLTREDEMRTENTPKGAEVACTCVTSQQQYPAGPPSPEVPVLGHIL